MKTLINNTLSDSLWELADKYITEYKNAFGYLPVTELDEQWPSTCQVSLFEQDKIHWQPMAVKDNLSFANIEQALDIDLHQDIQTYFSTFNSENLDATSTEGRLSLLFAWNNDDFLRLQENIIGHILMKNKLKQKLTIFFAVTEEEDMILSIMNATGEIWLERVGCEPHRKIADSLVDFLKRLTPIVV